MTSAEWIKLGTKKCDRVNQDGKGYRVLARKCSAGYQCTHLDEPCQWVDKEGDGRLYNR